MEKTDTNIKNTYFTKTVLMITVILYHSCAFWNGKWLQAEMNIQPVFENDLLKYVGKWMSSFHIYAFTLVSGYIFAFKIVRGGYKQYGPFIKNKLKRLIVPYIFAAIIWVVPISVGLLHFDTTETFKNFILCIEPRQLWFLWMLFWIFVIVWPLWKVFSGNLVIGWIASIGFYCIGVIGNKFFPNIFRIWTACQYVIFFYTGIRIRLKEERNESAITSLVPWYAWIIANVALLGISMAFESRKELIIIKFFLLGTNLVLHLVGAIAAFVTLQQLASYLRPGRGETFFIKKLFVYSMPMYLFHEQIIYFTVYWLNGKINPYAHAGINFMAAVAGSFLISAVLMHWKITRQLIGSK